MNTKHILIAAIFLFFSNYIYSQEITQFPSFFGIEYYEDTQQISIQQVKDRMQSNVESLEYWNRANKHQTMVVISSIAEIGFLIWTVNNINNDESLSLIPTIGVLATSCISIGFSISSNRYRKKAILNYNEQLPSEDVSIHMGLTQHGVGLTFQF